MIRKLETFVPRPVVAYTLLCITSLFWAGGMVLTRGVHEVIPPMGLSFWRWATATLILLPIVWRELSVQAPLIRKNIRLFAWLGILQGGSATLMVVALSLTTAINATLVNAALPVGAVIAAWLLVRERSTFIQVVGIALAMVGVAIMLARADLQVVLGLQFNAGDLWAIAAVAGWSVYAVRLRKMPAELGALTTLFLIFASATVMLLPFYVVETIFVKPVPFGGTIVGTALFLGLVSSVLAIYVWNTAIRSVGPARATIFINLIPVFGAGLAIFFLGEELFLFHLAGAAMVAVGILLVTRRTRPADATVAEKA